MIKLIKNKVFRIFLIIIILNTATLSTDFIRIKYGKKSIFTIPVQFYKDGGTIYRIGIGYGVFEWKILAKKTIDNNVLYGVNIGDEIVLFPYCYYAPFDYYISPKIPLLFTQEY